MWSFKKILSSVFGTASAPQPPAKPAGPTEEQYEEKLKGLQKSFDDTTWQLMGTLRSFVAQMLPDSMDEKALRAELGHLAKIEERVRYSKYISEALPGTEYVQVDREKMIKLVASLMKNVDPEKSGEMLGSLDIDGADNDAIRRSHMKAFTRAVAKEYKGFPLQEWEDLREKAKKIAIEMEPVKKKLATFTTDYSELDKMQEALWKEERETGRKIETMLESFTTKLIPGLHSPVIGKLVSLELETVTPAGPEMPSFIEYTLNKNPELTPVGGRKNPHAYDSPEETLRGVIAAVVSLFRQEKNAAFTDRVAAEFPDFPLKELRELQAADREQQRKQGRIDFKKQEKYRADLEAHPGRPRPRVGRRSQTSVAYF